MRGLRFDGHGVPPYHFPKSWRGVHKRQSETAVPLVSQKGTWKVKCPICRAVSWSGKIHRRFCPYMMRFSKN